ncbi:MAG: hypothetical protein F6J90_38385 [Moorea sp. SIOASIH]|nr:hypothetical protein [Moorena sp. SIOASIH]
MTQWCVTERAVPTLATKRKLIASPFLTHPTALPCSLFPVPCSLFPVPCSLFPVPCSLLPTPCSLLPTPCSLLPTPCSLFPVPFSHQSYVHNSNTKAICLKIIH